MQNSPRRHRDTSRDWKRNAQRPCAPSRPRPRTFPSRFVALRKTEIFGCPRAAFAYLRGRRGPCAWASWFRSWLLMCGVCPLLYVPPKKCYCRSGFFANVLNKKVRGLKGRPFAWQCELSRQRACWPLPPRRCCWSSRTRLFFTRPVTSGRPACPLAIRAAPVQLPAHCPSLPSARAAASRLQASGKSELLSAPQVFYLQQKPQLYKVDPGTNSETLGIVLRKLTG